MSDQGELAGRRSTSSDESSDAEAADRPARPSERVSAFRGQVEGADEAGADPADHPIFQVRRRPLGAEGDTGPRMRDSAPMNDAGTGSQSGAPGGFGDDAGEES